MSMITAIFLGPVKLTEQVLAQKFATQQRFICSFSTIETREKGVRDVQS